MKVLAFPADNYGCGYHRVIAPCEVLQRQGHDVTVVTGGERSVRVTYDKDGDVSDVDVPADVDVVVLQRVCDRRLLGMVSFLVDRGTAVVIDVDDDLSAIHPSNPAWTYLDPHRAEREVREALRTGKLKVEKADMVYAYLNREYNHSWNTLVEACKRATLVTMTTPGLMRRYAGPEKARVIDNYVPERYLLTTHVDSAVIGWPAALHSHPNDPPAVGNAISRVVSEGAEFRTIGDSKGVHTAFGLRDEVPGGDVTLAEWPDALAQIGIGIAPLADTLFNRSKSRLKILEMSACGVPWVASPRAEYRKLHALGAGVLAEKPRQWYTALRRLLDDESYRLELSAAGLEVARSQRLETHAHLWWSAWEDAAEMARNGSQVRSESSA